MRNNLFLSLYSDPDRIRQSEGAATYHVLHIEFHSKSSLVDKKYLFAYLGGIETFKFLYGR